MRHTSYSVADVNKSHNPLVYVNPVLNGVEQGNSPIRVIGGSMTLDTSAAVRRHLPSLKLQGYHPELDPFTVELRPYMVINDEPVPLGVFRLEDPEFSEDRNGVVTAMQCYDRAYHVASLRLPNAYDVGGDTVDVTIKKLLLSRYPAIEMNFTPSTYVVPFATFDEESDPWDKCLGLAAAAGMELFFDVDGICILRPISSDIENVVATYGSEAHILKVSKKQSTKETYSHAIVTAENPSISVPLRADRYDDNDRSPTFYRGTFGDRPTWLRSQFINSPDQCNDACEGLLARSIGRSETIALSGIPNPAHDGGDVVRVVRSSIGADAVCVLDTIDLPFELGGEMQVGTRARRVA